jgi:hypothetical protein
LAACPAASEIIPAQMHGQPAYAKINQSFRAHAIRQATGTDHFGHCGAQAQCSFVEPSRTILIDVVVAPNDGLAGDGQDKQVAGRPAKWITSIGERSTYRRLCTLPVSGTSRGQLCLAVTFLAGRGVENDARPDASKESEVEPALADIVRKYFA